MKHYPTDTQEPRTFKVFDKDGKPHYFDKREDCERFMLSIGHSRPAAEYFSAHIPPLTRTDDADRMKRVARLDAERADARQRMIQRSAAASGKTLGAEYFGEGK